MKAHFQGGLVSFWRKYPHLTFTKALDEFARYCRISIRTGWRWKPDIPKRSKSLSKWRRVRTSEERHQIHALAAQGWSTRRIGRHLGRDHHTVRRWLARPADYFVKHPCRPRDVRGRFVALQDGERLAPRIESRMLPALAPEDVPRELEALKGRLQAALDGSRPLPGQEFVDLAQRMRQIAAQLGATPQEFAHSQPQRRPPLPAPPPMPHPAVSVTLPEDDDLRIRMPR